jgi:translocation protein SEC72
LTIPILIYLVMVPMWSRARRFANVYAFACLDSFSVILWLSAWAAVASYVSAGKGKGDKKDESGCDNFKYGSPGRCKLSEAIIVFGVFEMLLFIATAFISFRAVMTFKRTGMMPENLPAGGSGMGGKNDFSAQTQNDFSSNMRNDDDDFEDQVGGGGRQDYGYQKPSLDDSSYAPVGQYDHDNDLAHLPAETPQSPLNHNGLGIHDYDTSYNPGAVHAGGGGHPMAMPMPER